MSKRHTFLAILVCAAAPFLVLIAASAATANPSSPSAFETLDLPEDPAPILAAMRGHSHRVWLDDDILHFAVVSEEGPVFLTGGIQMPMHRLPETDVWILRLRHDEWRRAFVSYAFMIPSTGANISMEHWRGDDAPRAPRTVEEPLRMETYTIESKALGETRTITVVLPPGEHEDLPAIVMADGQGAASWGRIISGLLEDGRIRPVAIVGIHSGSYRGTPGEPFDVTLDDRSRDYLLWDIALWEAVQEIFPHVASVVPALELDDAGS